MPPENTSLYLSERSLVLYPTLVQPHAEHLPLTWVPSILGSCSLSVNLWGPAWVLPCLLCLDLDIPSHQVRSFGS